MNREMATLDSEVTVLRLRSWERAERQVRAEKLKLWLGAGAVLLPIAMFLAWELFR